MPSSPLIEVCIDNIGSLSIAERAGANRIELCSSLATGGLTPSFGYMLQAKKNAKVPVYAIIRPRGGDFFYSDDEINIMLEDIYQVKKARLQGVVIGALEQDASLAKTAIKDMVKAASGLGITFHRAIDHAKHLFDSLGFLIEQKVERVLSSGQAKTAEEGVETLKDMVDFCQGRLAIMPGAGVSAQNGRQILKATGAREVHLSGKTTCPSPMLYQNLKASMGGKGSDFDLTITDFSQIKALVEAVNTPNTAHLTL